MVSEIDLYVYRNRERLFDRSMVIYPTRSVEQSRIETVREMLANGGRITRVYLDELGKIEELPTGVGLRSISY